MAFNVKFACKLSLVFTFICYYVKINYYKKFLEASMTEISKQKKIALIILIVLVSLAVLGGVATGIYFGVATISTQGFVLEQDTDQPIANVSVTDGKNVVKTDSNGKFKLKGWHKARFVTITNPSGYWTENYYQEITRSKNEYNFTLKKVDADQTNHSFMQITDTEISNEPGDWFNFLKEEIDGMAEKPAFLIHTGDICYENGLRNHGKFMSTQTMGIPVRYTIGNHDFVNIGSYSEEMFEDNYGPVNYSFDVGEVHYIVSSLAYGDYPAKYTFNDVVTWMQNDLANIPDGRKVVIFNHDVCRDETGMILKSGSKKIELKKEGVIAWINGHLHYNFINNYDGILNISTTPLVGGIDGSIGGVRVVNIEGNAIANTYMHYTDYKPEASEDGYAWQVNLAGRNLYTDPVLVGDKVYVGMMENDYPRQPVFACLNAQTGEIIWSFRVETSVKNNFYMHDGMAIVQDSSGIVYGFDADTGEKKWEKDMNLITYRYSLTGITGEGDKVYCGNSRFVYCFNLKDGTEIWKANKGSGEPSAYRLQIIGEQLIVGDNWRVHYALDKATGKLAWKSPERVNTQPGVISYNGYIYALSSNTIIKYDSNNGKILEKFVPKSSIGETDGKEHDYNFNVGSAPCLEGNIAYLATNKNGVIALNMDTMQVLWECNTNANMIYASPYSGKGSKGVEASVVIKNDKLYFGGMDGNLYLVSKSNGAKLDTFKIGSPILSKVVIGSSNGQDFVIVSDFEGIVTKINLNADGTFNRIINS